MNFIDFSSLLKLGRGKIHLSWKNIWLLLKWSVIGLFGLSVILFIWYARDLPTPGVIRDRPIAESSKLYDRNGELLFEVSGEEKRTALTSTEIPDNVKKAAIAAEDHNFYKHYGIDLRAIARAIIADVISGRAAQGGSTITQQYVKNALLSSRKSIDRKIKELILSLEIEAMFSKDEILTLYLNEIPYGSNNYGVQSAARSFFDKSASELELHEAAMLAALPQAPTYYSPYGTHTKELKERRNFVLNQMVSLGMITQAEATVATRQEIKVLPRKDTILAPHFVFYVKEKLAELFNEQLVEEGGLQVTTTLDLDLQRKAQKAVEEGVEKTKKRGASNGALVSVDPNTGEILSMIGSANYFNLENDGNVNVTLASRQPGSSFKPIVYATAFKQRYYPAFVLWDVETDFGDYKPQNYDGKFRGPVTVRSALANSLNIPAVKMLALAGLNEALKTAHDLGISTLNDPDRYGLALVLGGGEVKPLEMASAFGVFASGGIYRPPVSILEVKDSSGKTLFKQYQGKGEKEVLDPLVAYEITSILSDNEARKPIFGAISSLFFNDRPVAVKTGTTQEYRDGWTVGYTPDLSVAVWVGNNDNTPMNDKADGSIVAAPIFHNFMVAAHEGKEIQYFDQPKAISELKVDKISGKPTDEDKPDLTVDIFAPWQIPSSQTGPDQTLKINRLNGKLATEFTPDSLIEKRLYTVIHSERPNDYRWEEPVTKWAQEHSIVSSQPPTEQDDMYTKKEDWPQIKILSPTNESEFSLITKLELQHSSAYEIQSIELIINEELRQIDNSSPYELILDPSQLGFGDQIITVRLTDKNDVVATDTIVVTVVPTNQQPATVSGVKAQPSDRSVILSWINPADNNLEKIRIYVSTDPKDLGSLYPTQINAEPSTQVTFNILNLINSKTYYFTLRPVDIFGKEAEQLPYSISAIPVAN